jgi:hypothetical protein
MEQVAVYTKDGQIWIEASEESDESLIIDSRTCAYVY